MKIITGYAKKNRKNMTPAEARLKLMLSRWRITFRSQRPIDRYIADFILPDRRLVLEVDGSFHDNRKWYDAQRTKYIESKGFTVLRFTNSEVLETDCEHIRTQLLAFESRPVPQGEWRTWYGTAAY